MWTIISSQASLGRLLIALPTLEFTLILAGETDRWKPSDALGAHYRSWFV
jgi:hypothetical protein